MLFELKSVFLNDGAEKRLNYELDLSKLDIDGVCPFTAPVCVQCVASNRATLVTLIINVRFSYTRMCDRCGEEFTRDVNLNFTHRLVASLEGGYNDDYIETPDFTLELDDVVISDIVLSLPGKNLCREDCRGLCQICGQNLNNGECSCNRSQTDPRLEILKQLI